MLPVKSAFVVEIDVSGQVRAEQLTGRVEHVLSGAFAEFACGADMLRFIEEVLAARDVSE